MRDFSLESYEQQSFVLYYERKDKKIITYLADGNTKVEDNTKGTEDSILQKMEEQIVNVDEEVAKYYNKMDKNFVASHLPLLTAFGASSVLTTYTDSPVMIPAYLLLGYETIKIAKAGTDYFRTKEDTRDYLKHKLFLDNKEIITRTMNYDMRPLRNLSKIVKDEVLENINNRVDAININTVRLLTMDEVSKIVESAKEKDKKENPRIYKLTN